MVSCSFVLPMYFSLLVSISSVVFPLILRQVNDQFFNSDCFSSTFIYAVFPHNTSPVHFIKIFGSSVAYVKSWVRAIILHCYMTFTGVWGQDVSRFRPFTGIYMTKSFLLLKKYNQLFRLNQSPPWYLKGTRVSTSGLYKLFPFVRLHKNPSTSLYTCINYATLAVYYNLSLTCQRNFLITNLIFATNKTNILQ